MAKAELRIEAAQLYVQGLSCAAIAERLTVNEATVYRWKNEAARTHSGDWDQQRRVYSMSPSEMLRLYAESIKSWLVKIQNNPELLSDPKIADAIAKHVSVMQKIDMRGQAMGVVLDLIKVANQWLGEHQPKLKKDMEPHWDGIYQALVAYATTKGMF